MPEPLPEPSERTYRIRAKEVERLLAERGWTAARVARKLDVHPKTMRGWLKGNPAYVRNIVALAELLGERTQNLIEGFQPKTALGMSVNMSMDCASPDEFIYLCHLLAEVKEKFEDYRAQNERMIRIYYLPAYHAETKAPHYYYVAVDATLHEKFLDGLSYGIIADFALIIAKGEGVPTREVKDRIKADFGFDHDAHARRASHSDD